MAELGADLIKTFYTGERFHEVVQNTPVPVFTIGAEKLRTDLDVLRKAADSVNQGARGIIFGRNIFLARNPPALIAALNAVINDGVAPEAALAAHGLEETAPGAKVPAARRRRAGGHAG
jgi:DhnA family fructose-bisphosphate aldolase class Ia